MATRYCGNTKITCTYRDRTGDYRCTLSVGGKSRGVQIVGSPRHLTKAVDSPEAYDETVRAAIAFAVDDKQIDDSDIDHTDSGYDVHRFKPVYFPGTVGTHYAGKRLRGKQ